MSHGHHPSHHHCDLKENSPRPPVEGEETSVSAPPPCCVPASGPAYDYKYLLTPRISSLHPGISPDSGSSLSAPLGFEPEGCSGGAGHGGAGGQSPLHEGSHSPPTCLQWAKNLSTLLHDTEGVELFKKYLEQEGKAHADTLNFWFACEGLKKQKDRDRVGQLVKVIFRKFIQPGQLGINEELRREVTCRMRQLHGPRVDADRSIFDEIQSQVWAHITHTTYPNFLKSDIYLNYVSAVCHAASLTSAASSGGSSGSSSSSGGRDASALCGTLLPTLHEDCEFMVKPEPLPLTRDMLVATQARRAADLRPKPESFAGLYLQQGLHQHILHRAYSSYNPVSRQDSELQSLSSDARTDSDAMSCTDSSVDGTSMGQQKLAKRMHERQLKAMKESANINREVTHHNVIPRTQRCQDHCHNMTPERFAMVLTEKLEAVKRAQDVQDKLDRKLSETDAPLGLDSLADVIRQKLLVEEDCSQAILDQHVSRVWSDLTPSRSPNPHQAQAVANPYQARSAYPPRYVKKEKDVFSTFSSDSGNVHDWSEVPDSGRHFPKSKSVPDYGDQGRNSARRSARQKTLEQTDSGVSVVSDTPPSQHGKDSELVKTWLKESYQEPAPSGIRCKHRPAPARHARKYERSGSLERYPAQPFVADPSMPPLPSPHTSTQLEEARRRLIEDDQRWKQHQARQRAQAGRSAAAPPAMVCTTEPLSLSNQSTLRKSQRPSKPTGTSAPPVSEDFIRVMFWFCDEELPYRTKLVGKQVTLKQFKEILPKKGQYRYYFQTACDEVDVKAIKEEVTDDNQELPLWEGKLIAQVKPID